jgi:hypothetical protein
MMTERLESIIPDFRDLELVGSHMADARNFWIIHMPLQSIPPRESLHTAPNHQSIPEDVCSSLDALLVSHAPLDARSIQVSPIHPNSTAYPLIRFHPTAVSFDVTLEVWNALVALGIVTSNHRALEVNFIVDGRGSVFALEVARGGVGFVRVRTCRGTRRSAALFGSGASGTRRGKDRTTNRLGLRGRLALLLPLGLTVFFVVVRGRNVVSIVIELRTIEGVSRSGGAGERG